jgi:translocation and assembly module TamA
MPKCLCKLVFLSGLFLLMAATETTPPHLEITGLNKTQTTNVEHRLIDLYAHPTSHAISDAMLRHQVEEALTPYGFFEPQITITMPSKKKPGRIHVIPGPKLIVTRLAVQIEGPGHDNAELQQTRHDLPLQQGMLFSSIAYEEAKTNLLNAAEHQGYLNARFEQSSVLIDKAHHEAQITLLFNTGKRSYLGIIHFKTGKPRPAPQPKNDIPLPRLSKFLAFFNPSGNRYSPFSSKPIPLSDNLLYRYAPFKYNDPYSPDAIMAFNSNLNASGYFKTVDVRPGETHNHYVPLNVNLEPTDRFSYSLSGGYGTDTGARGRVGLHIIPLNAAGHKLDVVGQGSSNQNAAQMKYTIPGNNPAHEQYTINGGFNNLNYVSGNSQAGRFSLVYQNIMPKYQHILSLNGLHEAFRYDQQRATEKTVVYPKATLAWREVSDPLFSPSGYNITVNGFAAARAAFSSISVAELSIDAKAAYTVDLIRTRFYGHVVQGVTQVKNIYELPLSLALLLGGPETMKGYSYNSIGPGKLLSYGGIEVQKETFDTWYVLGFIDKGTVFRPDPKLVQYDIGIGLMWRSPVGPIKMAIAQPTDSRLRAMPDTGVRFVVNMGPDI